MGLDAHAPSTGAASELAKIRAHIRDLRASRLAELDAGARALEPLRLAVDHALAAGDTALAGALVERELALHDAVLHLDATLRELDQLAAMLAAQPAIDAVPGGSVPATIRPVPRRAAGQHPRTGPGRAGPRRALHALRKALITLVMPGSTS